MDRRDFIRQSAATGMAMSLGMSLDSCQERAKKITILHTNDVHSHIEAFDSTHPRYPKMGGVARRAELISAIRNENPNTLLFDAGDIFQGTPYFNYFGGELEFKMMSKLGYDAATIGNHDFDNGIDGLEKQLPHANFDFVISNYDMSNTIMDGKTRKFAIYDLQGVRIGVFGLGIELKGLVDPRHYKETVYLDPFEIAEDMVTELRERQHCDLVVCLSHMGYYYKRSPDRISDLNLAKQSRGIDLIIGGHTHTFLKKPTVVKNRTGENMLVNQVGCWGVQLGRVDFEFDLSDNVSANGKRILV